MKYISPIDPHVHLRWNEYPDHPFTQWALEDASDVGLAAVMEMPNTTPPLLTSTAFYDRRDAISAVVERIAESERYTMDRLPRHYLHMGLSTRMTQMAEAFQLAHGTTEPVRGLKMYCCHSTGDMGLLTERCHQNVWYMAVERGYTGPIIVHAEDHTRFGKPSLREQGALVRLVSGTPSSWREFDPAHPVTHSLFQHEDAEVISAVQQCRYAVAAGFRGTIVIAHTSSPDTVEAVAAECIGTDVPFRVRFEVTWHHLFLNAEDDYPIHGNRVKMNPPLRRKACQEGLLNKVFDDPELFFIGTDHAPHPVAEKDSDEPKSGIPALPFWPRGIELLRNDGMDAVSLRKVTFDNAAFTFGLISAVAPRQVEVEYDPSRWDRYGWNPFQRWG